MKYKRVLACALILLTVSANTYATHLAGGELTFTWLHGTTYKFNAVFYRDCAGLAAPGSLTLNYLSVSCSVNQNATLNQVVGTGGEMVAWCPSSKTTCNGGTNPGFQKWEYADTVDIGKRCTDWVFSWVIASRSTAVTTINSPGSTNMYVEATLDNLDDSTASSPVFSVDPQLSICVGQHDVINYGAVDYSNDSIVSSLIAARSDATTPVNYLNPYSATNPVSSSPPAAIDPETGNIYLTPQVIQVGVIVVLVNKYHNGILTASTLRDIEIVTNTCNADNLPAVSGINGGASFDTTIVAGTPLQFNVYSSDADAVDSVSLSWNNAIPQAFFTVSDSSRPVGTFTWSSPQASNLPYHFITTARDNACPYEGLQRFFYNIHVQPAGVTIISAQSGKWSHSSTWIDNIVPAVKDTAVIARGHTVEVDVDATVQELIIDSAALLNIDTLITLSINGDFSNSDTVSGPGSIQFYSANSLPAGNAAGGVFDDNILLNLLANADLVLSAPVTINNLTLSQGDTLSIGTNAFNIQGNATLNGAIVGADSTFFNGGTAQIIYGNNGSISNMVIDNSKGVSLDPTNLVISNSLIFVNGNLNTDTDQVVTNYANAVTSSSSTGWINGALELNGIPSSGDASMSFEVGGATLYDPVDLDLHGLNGTSGSFRASTFAGNASKSEITSSPLDTAKSVIRTWTVSNLGTSFADFDLTLNYNTGEIPVTATQSQFIIAQTDDGGGHWTLDPGSTTGSSTQSVGLIYNSDFIVGEIDCDKLLSSVSTSVNNVSSLGGNDGAITITANKGYGPFNYKWSANDSASSRNDTIITIHNLVAGRYTVSVTTIGGCATTRIDTVKETPLGIDENQNQNAIRVWPNPAGNKLNIELNSNCNCLLKMLDITGRIAIKQITKPSGRENNHMELDLADLSRGIYILLIESAQASKAIRIAVK